MPSTRFMYKRLKGDHHSSPNESCSNMTYKPLFFSKYAALQYKFLHPSCVFWSTAKTQRSANSMRKQLLRPRLKNAPAERYFSPTTTQLNKCENRTFASNGLMDRNGLGALTMLGSFFSLFRSTNQIILVTTETHV